MSKRTLQIAQIVPITEAEGPGTRFAIWMQGCPLRCSGCCNPEMLKFEGGKTTPVEELIKQILDNAKDNVYLEGITLLGGEPFSHARGLDQVAKAVQEHGLTVMAFTGFLLEDLREREDSYIDRLIRHTDILVDGPYDRERPDSTRRWIGSANQRVHFLSNRYAEADSHWERKDTLEIRLQGNQLTVNGFPAKNAVGVWKRPKVSHQE
ncbi:MAG: 4Fe-4S single cluster domain-containing protein [Mariniblastus sp.]|nr:4Fe-4S single cluster domain-containing protein [Mariniblastus sp.]